MGERTRAALEKLIARCGDLGWPDEVLAEYRAACAASEEGRGDAVPEAQRDVQSGPPHPATDRHAVCVRCRGVLCDACRAAFNAALSEGGVPSGVRALLGHIRACAEKKLPDYPKGVSAMTDDEVAIARVGSEAVGGLLFCGERALTALRLLERADRAAGREPGDDPEAPDLWDALDEMTDLMEAVVAGEYTPDSFTTQGARRALDTNRPNAMAALVRAAQLAREALRPVDRTLSRPDLLDTEKMLQAYSDLGEALRWVGKVGGRRPRAVDLSQGYSYPCDDCGQTGQIGEGTCERCDGAGRITVDPIHPMKNGGDLERLEEKLRWNAPDKDDLHALAVAVHELWRQVQQQGRQIVRWHRGQAGDPTL